MRTLLRYLLDEREWRDHDAFLPHFRKAARELADFEEKPSLATLAPAKATFEAWYYGKRQPQRDARRVLVHMFGYSVDQLWSEVPDGTAPAVVPLFSAPQTEVPAAARGMDLHEMRRTGAMAARRAIDFALGAEREQLGEETLGFLSDEVKRIAEEYPRVPLAEIWDDLAKAQDEAFRLLESGRARPSQSRDLHFMATLLSFFMAKGSHDMGDAKVAMAQARAAGFCAKQAEHKGLIALVDGLKSLISYWANKPEDALHYARHGAAEAPGLRGTVGVWLPSLEARAAALLGDEEAALAANRRAENLREQVVPDDLDGLGGLLTYPEIKQLYYAVESQVLLGHGDAEITMQAEEAVRGFSNTTDPAWAFGDQAGAQCNLALVRLYAGDLDGAAAAVRPVLDLAPGLRNNGIVVSAERVRAALASGPVRNALVARDLRSEIEMYQPPRPALPR
ncbi:hypothetical protein [Streptomyces sp. NPDC058374]|uniref:hypothetical protein n=1 Tax=Streptomyces sp. NPDC058374 TaxID=3346466 RepID=UPI0036633E45